MNDQPTTPDLTTPDARIEFVRALWQEVLETDDVAEDLGFFDAGGDSLRLVMLVERMSQESGRAVGTMDLFRAGTVRGHAEVLAGTAAAPAAAESSRDRLLRLAKAGAAD